MTQIRVPADTARTDRSQTWTGTQDFTGATVLGVAGGAGGSVAGATATAAGVVQLAGDLAGPYTAPTVAKLGGVAPAAVATSGKYSDLTGAPALAPVATSGAYTDLTGKPALATVATSGAYTDLTGKPALATVATSGSYTDLANKPTIPAAPTKPTIRTDTGVTGTVYWINAEGVVTVVVNCAAGGAFASLGALPAGYRPVATASWYIPVSYVNGSTVQPGTLQMSPGNGLLQQDGQNRTGYQAYATFSFPTA